MQPRIGRAEPMNFKFRTLTGEFIQGFLQLPDVIGLSNGVNKTLIPDTFT